MRSNRLGNAVAIFVCVLLAGSVALAQQSTAPTNPTPQATNDKPEEPVTAQQKKPPPKPDSFKPTEEVRADTILTLPSDI